MYYVYKIEWSQTDFDYCIIKCDNGKPAEILKRRYPNAKYFHLETKTENFHNN
jgi:hypothetical protein